MHHYPFHIGDFRAGCIHMTKLERWLYRDLLDVVYDTERPLPVDHELVFRSVGARTQEERDAVEAVLKEKFELTEDGYVNRRVESEIEKYHKKADSARNANQKRWASGAHLKSDTDQIATKNQEPITNTPTDVGVARKRATAARPDDVAEPVWQDFQRLRAQKRSPLTDTALAGLRREAAKAGIGLGDALAFCCEQGWQGFNAGWYADRTGKQPRASPPAASFRERDAAAASERYRRLTGQESPVVTEIPTMKAIAQ